MDIYYLILVLPAILLSLWASSRVNSTFKKYSGVFSSRSLTGAMAAEAVLRANGVYGVRIERVSGKLTDHYDPRGNVIRLSDSVYASTSVAAIGVACHEAGHAVQYASNYAPIKLRAAIIPITNVGSKLAMPLILLGILFSAYSQSAIQIAYIGVILFSATVLFQLFTLPTEFNASRRAMNAMESNALLTQSELPGARKVLSAAAMTYVAALAVSITQLLRLFLIVSSHSRRRD